MKKQLTYVTFLLVLLIAPSCAVQKYQAGNYTKKKCKPTVHNAGVELYAFWEQLQVRKVKKSPSLKDYEKVMTRNPVDYLVFFGTFGLLSPYQVQIKEKNCNEKQQK